jgi:hypothetical protein
MMRLSLRNPAGLEIDRAVVEDTKDAVYEGMRVLARQTRFDVGSLLVVDDDNEPMIEPKVQPTVTAGNLLALAARLEARAGMMTESQSGVAVDLQVAARLCRHAVKVWVTTSVSLTV